MGKDLVFRCMSGCGGFWSFGLNGRYHGKQASRCCKYQSGNDESIYGLVYDSLNLYGYWFMKRQTPRFSSL